MAAFSVIVHHAPAVFGLSWLKGIGWAGVDLFLCISSFLLTRLLLAEHDRLGSISLRKFYIRRALRIWPLYFAVATLACAATAILKGDPRMAAGWWLSHLTFSNNLFRALLGSSPIIATSHLWTISLEEQAYLVLPIVLTALLAYQVSINTLIRMVAAAVGLLLTIRFAIWLAGAPFDIVWVTPLRSDSFLVGTVLAFLTRRSTPQGGVFWLLPGFGLIALVPLLSDAHWWVYEIFGFTIVAVGCGMLVLATQASPAVSRVLSFKPLRYLGKISYGIYVFHVLALKVTEWLSTKLQFGAALTLIATVALTVAISVISYELFEKIFLRLKERFTVIASRPV
ncbi:MAG: acyltransferase [Sphingomonas sp.]|nr:acyltransferase [Sphingomonas sp.]